MKKAVILILSVFLILRVFAGGPDKLISCHYSNVSFIEFSKDIQNKSGVYVFYRAEWVDSLQVSINKDSITVLEAVKFALEGSNLKVSVWNNNIVLTPEESLLTHLPDFKPESAEETQKEESRTLTASEERYLTGRKPEAIQTIKVGRAGAKISGTRAKVLGRVIDQETGEPVYNATIYIEETRTGAVSDINGFFTIMLKPGKYNAVFDFIGYEKKKYLLEVFSDGDFTIHIKKTVYQIDEFVVMGDRQSSITEKDPGLDKISMRTIKELPMLMGERDILKVSGTLPGIVSVGEGTAGLNVRGGSADQNAFYINKIPIYNTSHMFGFFPAFNSDIIKDFSIYKGHIPAQYGGRLSSVFNIITRQGNRKHFTAHGGVSPTSANLVVEGPIKKDVCSVQLSGRSTFSDWILRRINDADIRASSAGFYDFSGGINFDNQKTQMGLFVYHSKDRFDFSDITDYNYANSGASFSLSRNFTKSLRGEFSLVGSQYNFNTIDKQEASSAYEHNYEMGDYEFRADFKQVISDANTLDFGLNLVYYTLNRGKVTPYGVQSLRDEVDLGTEQGLESALYISDSYDVRP